MSSSCEGVKKGFHTFSPLFYKITHGASPYSPFGNGHTGRLPAELLSFFISFLPQQSKGKKPPPGQNSPVLRGGRASGRGPLCPKRLTNIESPSSGASHDFIKMRRSRFRFPSSLSAEKHFAQMPQKKRRTPMRLLISHLFLASAAKAKNSLTSDV